LKAFKENYQQFIKKYFLSKDSFRRKSMSVLAQILVIVSGRPSAVFITIYGLQNAENDLDLATVLQFIKDVEYWEPGLNKNKF